MRLRGRGGYYDEDHAGKEDNKAPVRAAKQKRKVVLDETEV
jgi:hypothetical protein